MSRPVWAALVVLAVSLVYLFRLDSVAGLMVDDAWYMVLAKALANGDGYRLISSATEPIMPVVPPGFAALLSPVFLLSPTFPANLMLLKAVSVVAMLGVGIASYYHLTTCRQASEGTAAAVVIATVLTPALVFLATSSVMAECTFALVQLLAVILLDRRPSQGADQVRWAALAGVMTALGVLLRSAGIALLVAGTLYLLQQRSWRRAGAFVAPALLCLAPWFAYSAAHAPTPEQSASHGGTIVYPYSELIAMRSPGSTAAGRAGLVELPARVSRNFINVFGRDVGGVFVPGFYRGANESGEETVGMGGEGASMGSATATLVVSFALSAVLLVGLIASLQARSSVAEVLVVVSAGMILLVPTRTFRYLLPLAPFLWFYLVTGIAALAAMVRSPLGQARRAGAAMVVTLSLIGLQVLDHVQYLRLRSARPPEVEWLKDARAIDEVLLWMEQNLPAGAPVASTNPGLVFLRTGRKGVASADPSVSLQAWQAAGIHYLVALRPMPLPARSLGFRRLYESRRLWVVALDNY